MIKYAVFSPDRTYRYILVRRWDEDKPFLAVIGLNPSTADESTDDPTVRRCIRYARDWGYGGLKMFNLLAYRSTDPRRLRGKDHPHEANRAAICSTLRDGDRVLVAWGVYGGMYREAANRLLASLAACGYDVYCLGTTRTGQPKHPLYLRADVQPILYRKDSDDA